MTKILIIGATGSIGTETIKQLLTKSDVELTLLARHIQITTPVDQRLNWVQGDATQLTDLMAVMAQQDVVVISASGQLPPIAETVVTAMNQAQVSRLILISSMGIYNEIPVKIGREGNLQFNPALKPYRQAADIVEQSGLNYTIIRPGWFDQGNHDYEVTVKGTPFGGYDVSRWAIADLVCRSIADDSQFGHQNLGINRPI